MAIKAMQKNNMASETVRSFMRSGLMTEDGHHVEIPSGSHVVAGDLAVNPVYGYFAEHNKMKDFNVFEVKYPTAEQVAKANLSLYIADPVAVSEGLINGVMYREGAKTLGLAVDPEEPCALRKLVVDDMFYLTEANFESKPTVGEYAKLTATKGTLTPNATVPATGYAVQILDTKNFVEGIDPTAVGYLCRVVQL